MTRDLYCMFTQRIVNSEANALVLVLYKSGAKKLLNNYFYLKISFIHSILLQDNFSANASADYSRLSTLHFSS